MARRKKRFDGWAVLLVVGFAAARMVPAWGLWIIGLMVFCGVIYMLRDTSPAPVLKQPPAPKALPTAPSRAWAQVPAATAPAKPIQSAAAPAEAFSMYWVAPGNSVKMAGRALGGMIYYGNGSSGAEPSLINPRLTVGNVLPDLSQDPGMGYYPAYSEISPAARRGYLEWLATGREHPTANIGYVFIYFYGLERRALLDCRSEETGTDALKDLPAIEQELRRLLILYSRSTSFRSYAEALLEMVTAQRRMSVSVLSAPAPSFSAKDVPFTVKFGLAQYGDLKQAIPADWALAWAVSDPRINLPASMRKCPSQFSGLFRQKYHARHGEGLVIKPGRTKLSLNYQAASGSLRHRKIGIHFELTDITASTTGATKLKAIADDCTTQLAPYARLLTKRPDAGETLDGILMLPRALWPASAMVALDDLGKRIGDGLIAMTLGDLAKTFGGEISLSRDRIVTLARALAEISIGFEPDVLAGARAPKVDDQVVLFRAAESDGSVGATPGYMGASVTLDMMLSVASSDNVVSANEMRRMTAYIDSLATLPPAQRKRLRARMKAGMLSPPTLASLKKKIEPMPPEARRAVAHLISSVAQADGDVSPAEVRAIEKIYKLMGLDAKLAYSDLHSAAAAHSPAAAAASAGAAVPGFSLDQARIAELNAETARVSELLAGVFADEEPAAAPVAAELPTAAETLLGLDAEHSAFLRALMARSEWARADLADMAADRELMLDGAIERINEAAFDHLGEALIEGDDPITLLADALEKISA